MGCLLGIPYRGNRDLYHTTENLAFWNEITGLGNTQMPCNLKMGVIQDANLRVLFYFIATFVICKKGSFFYYLTES